MKNYYTHLLTIFLLIAGLSVSGSVSVSAQSGICDSLDIELIANGVECGSSKGSIDVIIKGGYSGLYRIEWDDLRNRIWEGRNIFLPFYTIEDLEAGEYIIKVMDLRSYCFVMKRITLESGVAPRTMAVEGNAVSCRGFGEIAVAFSGRRQPPYRLTLNGPVNANYVAHSRKFKLFNLPVGDYQLTLNEEGCRSTVPVTIDAGENLPTLKTTDVRGNCFVSTGNIKFDIEGGLPPYTLYWNGSQKGSTVIEASQEISGFESGDYNFWVEDQNGCRSYSSLSIDRSLMSVSLSSTDATCSRSGAIEVDITGGQAPYYVVWRSSDSYKQSRNIEGQHTRLVAGKGTYQVEIRDANGCTTFASITVGEKMTDLYCSITAEATNCGEDNGVLRIFISGGKKPYEVSVAGPVTRSFRVNGSTTLRNLPPGEYFSSMKDAEGCIVSESQVILENNYQEPEADFSYSALGTSVNFFSHSIGGEHYYWTFGNGRHSRQISPAFKYPEAGSYEVCLTVRGACGEDTECQTINLTALQTDGLHGSSPVQFDKEETPHTLKVEQNQPNPFRDNTSIRFHLPKEEETTITVFSLTGQIIERSSAVRPKGINIYTFNQNNLTSGLYLYSIRTESGEEVTKRMIVK